MKNNFITKIIGVSLAIAMMIGGAVGINAAKEAKEVNAATSTVNFIKSGYTYDNTVVALTGSASSKSGASYWGMYGGASLTTTATYSINSAAAVTIGMSARTYGSVSAAQKTMTFNVLNAAGTSILASGTLSPSTNKINPYSGTISAFGSDTNLSVKFQLVSNAASTDTVFVGMTSATFTYTDGIEAGSSVELPAPIPQYDSENNRVIWDDIENASGYQVSVGDEDHYVSATSPYDGSFVADTEYTVYVKAIGDGDTYTDSQAGSVTFTAVAPFESVDYVLCTSVDDLEAGANYIFTNGTSGTVQTMATTDNTNNRKETNVSVNAVTHRVASTRSTLVVELGGTSDSWTFETTNYLGTAGSFASGTGDNNHLRVFSTAGTATIAFNNNNSVAVTIGPNNSRNVIKYNSNNGIFACYASDYTTNVGPVYLWKEYKELDHLSVTGSLEKTSYYDSEEFSSAGLTISAVYSDSSSKVLAANEVNWGSLTAGMTQIRGSYTENGVTKYTEYFSITVAADTLSSVSLSGTMGTNYYLDSEWDQGTLAVIANYASNTHVTVTNDATIAYYSDSAMNNEVATPADLGVGANQTIYVKATYNTVSNTTGYAQTVTVSIEPGTTEANPLTVAAAVEFGMDTLEHNEQTTKQYYIQGVVSQIVENNLNTNNKKATFWLQNGNVDQGFEVYQITPAAGCTNYSDFRVGSEVLIKCQIKRYNSIIETGNAKSLLSISYTAPTLTGISLNKTTLNFAVGDYDDLVVSPSPLGAETGEVTWTTSNQDVATVDQNGHVVAVGAGEATITATAGGFNATCNVAVSLKDTMEYNAGSTTNMAASGNATTVNLDPNLFTVDAAKGGNQNFPGLNKDDDIRAYSGNDIIVTINSNYTITNIEIDYASGDSYSQVSVNGVLVTGNNGVYAINSSSFKIHANGGMVKMYSVDIFYRNATAAEKVSRSTTQTQLSYRYTGNAQDGFEYSDISIRFGANITKALWDELDTNEHLISGFGVIIADGDLVTNAADMAEAMNDKVSSTVTTTFTQEVYAIDYFVPVANMASTIGEDANNYFWNLRWAIDEANMDKMYSAVAYIKVGDEYVLMNMARESVETLALDYLTNRGCTASTAEGSLKAIVDNA